MHPAVSKIKTITVVSTIDNNYLLPFTVLVESLLSNKGEDFLVEWFVFESGVTDAAKKNLDRCYDDTDVRFIWITQPMTEFEKLPLWGRAVPKMYQRLGVADFFPPDMPKILYLDADLLVLENIKALWDIELDNMTVGAVQDMAVPTVSSPLGVSKYKERNISPGTRYFNSGVLLINLPIWRRDNISDKALSYLETCEDIGLMDQEALNAVLHHSWKPIHYRWNVIGSVAGRRFFKARHLDEKQYEEAVDNPAIVHFGGHLKPWQIRRLGSRWDREYKRYLSRQNVDYSFDTDIKAHLYGIYDRCFRSCLYPLERAVWNRMRK